MVGVGGVNAAAAAAAAAAARAGKAGPGTRPATVVDDDGDMESMEVPPAAVTADFTAVAHVSSSGSVGGGSSQGGGGGGGAGVDSDALTALIEMGFAPSEARGALEAAGGDIMSAVDILSSAAQP